MFKAQLFQTQYFFHFGSETEGGTPQRQQDLGVKHLACAEIIDNSNRIVKWIKSTGASKIDEVV